MPRQTHDGPRTRGGALARFLGRNRCGGRIVAHDGCLVCEHCGDVGPVLPKPPSPPAPPALRFIGLGDA